MAEADESLLKRLRETLLRTRQVPERSLAPSTRQEAELRDAVRKLARNRVSEVLRQLRAARGYTYEQVRASTGLTQQLLYDLEYKDRRLTLPELRLLAECYEVSVNDLLGIDLED